jgi:hypothetical protein
VLKRTKGAFKTLDAFDFMVEVYMASIYTCSSSE